MRLSRATTAKCCPLEFAWMSSWLCSFNREKISQQPGVQRKAAETDQRGRPDNRPVASQIRIHCRRKEPQLEHHQYQHDAQDSEYDRRLLFASESSSHNI